MNPFDGKRHQRRERDLRREMCGCDHHGLFRGRDYGVCPCGFDAAADGPAGLQSFVPGTTYQPNTPDDIAWSEYNHHWAGIIVLTAGFLALAAPFPSFRFARHWPLVFLAWLYSCSSARTRRTGRSVLAAFGKASPWRKYCSTAFSYCSSSYSPSLNGALRLNESTRRAQHSCSPLYAPWVGHCC